MRRRPPRTMILTRRRPRGKLNRKGEWRMKLRFTAPSDGASLQRIYAQYIDTPVTFECSLPSTAEFAERIESVSAFYPFLVCENRRAEVVGYAYAHRHMEREAYQWNAELSVYLDAGHTARGIGRRLYCALLGLIRLQGIKAAYGGVTIPNAASEKLHAALGFTKLGTYHNAGYKCGAWHDVAWYEKNIAPYDAAPRPVLPLCAIDEAQIAAVLENV